MSTSISNAVSQSTSGSRSRPQARRKPNDDAAYFASGLSAGTKRHASDRVDGETRVKRKRVDPANSSANATRRGERMVPEGDTKVPLEFVKLPTATLYRYLAQFDLIPTVYPSPLTADDPPPAFSLDRPLRLGSRAPSPPPVTTPANRPRRENKEQSRRRSSRLLEEEAMTRTPVLADVREIHTVLAGIAERHFREEHSVKEVDTLASFMCAVKARGTSNG